jgi:hypothetical protein
MREVEPDWDPCAIARLVVSMARRLRPRAAGALARRGVEVEAWVEGEVASKSMFS